MQHVDMLEANREYFREHAARYDSDEQPFVHQRAFVEKMLARFDGCPRDLRILDFGAGTGSSTQTLVKSFPAAQVVGLDVSPEMLAIASRKCPRASFSVFDGSQVPFDTNWFDIVLVSSVLHHIEDYEHVLLEIARVCSTQGRILITQEPNPPVVRWVNRMRRMTGQNVPDLVKRMEGHQFSEAGGIPPCRIIEILASRGFSTELIYNNDALLDCLLKSHRVLYRLLKPVCRFRMLPVHVSYNVIAERRSSQPDVPGDADKP